MIVRLKFWTRTAGPCPAPQGVASAAKGRGCPPHDQFGKERGPSHGKKKIRLHRWSMAPPREPRANWKGLPEHRRPGTKRRFFARVGEPVVTGDIDGSEGKAGSRPIFCS